MDAGFAHHADVLKKDGNAYIFYFCHPWAKEAGEEAAKEPLAERDRNRAVVQAARLEVRDGILICDRNAPVIWEKMES
ncbi:MAG TPA: hypothetical protein H9912_11390 [Candidatus Eisenbergiella stercorigallinarum]|uniref:Uncharacterized protein n=1 Tax=Candidatus Eisenbergiella stercorigallinarum TaxID=2838557 RepID=A0A9D2QZB2_9FIRM|nr:hypothetical protein [Candidatus Eisenbergiella stercorigallinarum]